MKSIGLFAAIVAAALAAPPGAQAASYSEAVLASDPLTYLRMEEAGGTVAQDSSVNDRDGTYANAMLGAAGPFVGAGSAVTLSASSSVTAEVAASSGSVELWVKPARLRKGEQQSFVAHGDPMGDGWSLGIGARRKLVLITAGKTIASRITIAANTWTMVAATWDATNVAFYINGGSTTKVVPMSGTSAPTSSNGDVQVGGTGFGSFTGAYAGDLDELALFDRALTATEIRAHFGEASLPYNTAPPVVTGTPTQGETLAVQPGAWTGVSGAFAYQWQRCDSGGEDCDDVIGATGTSYVLSPGDVGATLQVLETAINGNGSVTVASAPTTTVAGPPGTGSDPGTGDPGTGTDPSTGTDPGSDAGATPPAPEGPAPTGTSPGRCLRLVSGHRVRVRRLGRLRLRVARDGCIRKTAPLRLRFRSRVRVRSVRYRLDGKRLRAGRPPAFAASVRPRKLRPGRHILAGRVTPRKGRARTARLRLRVAIR